MTPWVSAWESQVSTEVRRRKVPTRKKGVDISGPGVHSSENFFIIRNKKSRRNPKVFLTRIPCL